ncbi:MAG: penicillin-binding protein 1A [Alphaproteobacteria bacterium]|nr:penicillin-binding protein 1A [Alphaproteobacteria bacterium]
MIRLLRLLGILVLLVLLGGLMAGAGGLALFYHYGRGLPDFAQLADYQPPVSTRIHAGDGRLLTEYAIEKRAFVPIGAIPKRVIDAFLSAEDKSFYTHPGIDPLGILRAVIVNVKNLGGARRPVGASTITQQVAKNFLLTNEVSIERKVKEMILAFRIERAFTKDHILELYMNEIYLGIGAYGVAAAALHYFDKPLDELTLAEAAYLAALPKAPNNYHPQRFPDAAKSRRDWVLERMQEDGVISAAEAEASKAERLVMRPRPDDIYVRGADWFAEEVRRRLAKSYGETTLYKGGLSVRTSLDPRLQVIADRVLRQGLISYDRRHGWRGPLGRVQLGADWTTQLAQVAPPGGIDPWETAIVLAVGENYADIGLIDGQRGRIPWTELHWARPALEEQEVGPSPKRASDVVKPGDVVAVEPVRASADGTAYPARSFALRQPPKIEGALVAMDPHTGRVLALSGGFAYARSQFNRATQAMRQPGSSFKPFIYLAALDAGYSPSSLILDAPFVMEQAPGLPKWKPQNYTGEFYGPSTMRTGIEKSRNLMTVRLAQAIGMDKVADYAQRFGITPNLQPVLSMALGAGETTVLNLTSAYAMIVNGGRRVTPSLIDRVQDRNGKTVYRHDNRRGDGCQAAFWTNQPPPVIPDSREFVTDPLSAYQMISMLQGVVERGTGAIVSQVGKPLAGKTGTSNDFRDAWFMGFSPDFVVGVFTGFDDPLTLGKKETGSAVAAPIFRDFMKEALSDKPATPFRIPPGIRLVRVSHATGRPAAPGEKDAILEAFKPDQAPGAEGSVLEGVGMAPMEGEVHEDNSSSTPTAGGLY